MSDVEVVEQIYEAMAAVDLERLVSLIDPSVVVTQDDRLPWGGRFEGHDGFGAFAIALRGAIDSKVEVAAISSRRGMLSTRTWCPTRVESVTR